MILGATLVALGVVIGTWVTGTVGGPQALAADGGNATSCLPAISFGRQDMVLFKDQGGMYFLMDAAGSVAPVRVSDVDVKNTAGKSILRAP